MKRSDTVPEHCDREAAIERAGNQLSYRTSQPHVRAIAMDVLALAAEVNRLEAERDELLEALEGFEVDIEAADLADKEPMNAAGYLWKLRADAAEARLAELQEHSDRGWSQLEQVLAGDFNGVLLSVEDTEKLREALAFYAVHDPLKVADQESWFRRARAALALLDGRKEEG